MSREQQKDLLHKMSVIAKGASQEIQKVRRRGYKTMLKSDRSPVTEADFASHHFITKELAALTPNVPIISEEDSGEHARLHHAPFFWLIDPLDGTRGFAEGDKAYAVNIALVHKERPLLGVVALPDYEEIYSGSPEIGAWCEKNGKREVPIHVRRAPEEKSILLSRHTPMTGELQAFLEKNAPYKIEKISSALKFMVIASGAADLYPRFAPTMEWDTGAPQAIVEGAGGRIITPSGQELSYRKAGWKNGYFICCGG